ncbi:hypothetical protein AMTRI_Chr04g190610 [Amborella trichopoda]
MTREKSTYFCVEYESPSLGWVDRWCPMTKQIVIIFHLPRLPKRRTRRRDDSSSHFFHPNFLSKNTLRLNSKLYPKEPNGAVCGGEPRRKPNGELSLIAKEKPIWRRMILIGSRCRPLNDLPEY